MEWLKREVVEGLQALVSLRLQGAPAADMIVLTASIWERAFLRRLGHHAVEEVDAPRIREGFDVNFPRLTEWPAPAEILDSMPPRPPRPALPEPQVSEEQHRENVKRAKAIVEELLDGWAKKGRVKNG